MDFILILLFAVTLDLALGEPPPFIHPVVWTGKVESFLEKGSFSQRPPVQFIYGVMMTLITIAVFAVPAYYLLTYLKNLNFIVYVVLGTLLFKSTFSVRELRRVARLIRDLLLRDEIDKAHFELRALVKRDTKDLPKPLLVSATIESVVENTSDSFVAPLFYFLLFGIPGAIAYRVVNTMDAMIGYHGKYEYLGKFAARLDDVLNFIPARLTALLLIIASFILRQNGRASWQVALNEHAKTESPNAGWPMAAAAGALDVQLEKVGHYRLGAPNKILAPQTIDTSLALAQTTMVFWAVICSLIGVIRFVFAA